MAYGVFKDLKEIFLTKYYVIKQYMMKYGYQRGLASMVHTFFDNKTSAGTVKN